MSNDRRVDREAVHHPAPNGGQKSVHPTGMGLAAWEEMYSAAQASIYNLRRQVKDLEAELAHVKNLLDDAEAEREDLREELAAARADQEEALEAMKGARLARDAAVRRLQKEIAGLESALDKMAVLAQEKDEEAAHAWRAFEKEVRRNGAPHPNPPPQGGREKETSSPLTGEGRGEGDL